MSLELVRQDFEELDRALGVKEPVEFGPLSKLHSKGDYIALCKAIGLHLGLANAVRLSTTSDSRRFTTHALSKTDVSGRGTHGIVAQVHIPMHLPMYGTASFSAYVIEMLLANGFSATNSYTAVALLAHELSHVLLHGIKHPNRTSEQFTDLVPIMMGFGDIVERGRVVTSSGQRDGREYTSTVTYGYLTDSEFALARKLTRARIAMRRSRKRKVLAAAHRTSSRARDGLDSLRIVSDGLRVLDLAKPRVRASDGLRIVELHVPGYLEEQAQVLSNASDCAEKVSAFCLKLTQYSVVQLHRLEALHIECAHFESQLSVVEDRLRSDSRIVLRTQSVDVRLRRAIKDSIQFLRRVFIRPWRVAV